MDAILSLPWFFMFASLAKTIGIIFLIVLPMVSYTVYAERRVSALIQDRLGPNRVSIPLSLVGNMFGWKWKDLELPLGGLGQPVADAIKFIVKEDLTPAHVNKFYYWLAPCLSMVPSILTLAVIPFGSSLLGVPMVIANVNVGPLFVFAIASLGVYGIVIAGYASNSKYPFLGGVRSSSQMISYELALGLSVIPIFLIVGKLNLSEIINYQIQHGWLLVPYKVLLHPTSVDAWHQVAYWPFVVISFVVFSISIFAETNRLPFDLPEAETELVSGYHTEYSSMKFALFFLGEYAAMIAGSSLIVVLFLGGWHFPGIPDGSNTIGLPFLHVFPGWIWGLVNIGVFFGKVAALLFIFIWVRWTLPRFRYDQLMHLGWIWFFEIALANILLMAIVLYFIH
ncbi:MAG TPA: complex I subunit 1 family protein [Chthoniobacteraceae bacterium]|nr:complex I subunit 1 family protein [Chthoniobacteraceae bacterium]